MSIIIIKSMRKRYAAQLNIKDAYKKIKMAANDKRQTVSISGPHSIMYIYLSSI